MPERALDVQARAVGPGQHPRGGHADRHADRGDRDDRAARDLGRVESLLTASTVTMLLTTSSVMPFPAADRISARFQPKVQAPEAGRAASRMAHSATAIAPTSDSMCPASDSSASDPESRPRDHLADHERGQQQQRHEQVAQRRPQVPAGCV